MNGVYYVSVTDYQLLSDEENQQGLQRLILRLETGLKALGWQSVQYLYKTGNY